jgi:hypothetical protein
MQLGRKDIGCTLQDSCFSNRRFGSYGVPELPAVYSQAQQFSTSNSWGLVDCLFSMVSKSSDIPVM